MHWILSNLIQSMNQKGMQVSGVWVSALKGFAQCASTTCRSELKSVWAEIGPVCWIRAWGHYAIIMGREVWCASVTVSILAFVGADWWSMSLPAVSQDSGPMRTPSTFSTTLSARAERSPQRARTTTDACPAEATWQWRWAPRPRARARTHRR